MAAILALLAAVCYGSSDFAAGVGSRRASPQAVAILAQPFALVASLIALILLGGQSPSASAMIWGGVSGLGSGIGVIALYRGFAVGKIVVVAPVSAVLTASLPAALGLSTGDTLSTRDLVGLALAIPAVALVSYTRSPSEDAPRSGLFEGVIAGAGFAVLFIALERAGTGSGAWPIIPSQLAEMASVLVLALALGDLKGRWRVSALAAITCGVLGGLANLSYLASTGQGQLSVVAVLSAMYPVVTVLLARAFLQERWSLLQMLGLALAIAAVGLVSAP